MREQAIPRPFGTSSTNPGIRPLWTPDFAKSLESGHLLTIHECLTSAFALSELISVRQTELFLPLLSINPQKLGRSLRIQSDDRHRDKQFNPTQQFFEKFTHDSFGIQKHLSRSQASVKTLSRYSARHPISANLSAIILSPRKSSEMIESPHNRENRRAFSRLSLDE
jgi:hypothetical protein